MDESRIQPLTNRVIDFYSDYISGNSHPSKPGKHQCHYWSTDLEEIELEPEYYSPK